MRWPGTILATPHVAGGAEAAVVPPCP